MGFLNWFSRGRRNESHDSNNDDNYDNKDYDEEDYGNNEDYDNEEDNYNEDSDDEWGDPDDEDRDETYGEFLERTGIEDTQQHYEMFIMGYSEDDF